MRMSHSTNYAHLMNPVLEQEEEATFHVEPPWDRGRKFIQTVQVRHLLFFIIVNLRGGRGLLAGILP